MKFFLILFLGLTACEEPQPMCNKILNAAIDGRDAYCLHGTYSECGVHLYSCTDGAEYFCVKNVRMTRACQ